MKGRSPTAVIAGVVAGTPMLALLVVGVGRAGLGWDSTLRWIAAFVGSEPALIAAGQGRGVPGAPTMLAVGVVIHFAAAIAAAWLFLRAVAAAALRSHSALIISGLVYGAIVWAFANWGGLLFDEVMYARVRLIPLTFLVAHLIYGLTLGFCAARIGTGTEPAPRTITLAPTDGVATSR
jgi:hypothetical protein